MARRSKEYERALQLMGRRVVVSEQYVRDEKTGGKITWTAVSLDEPRVGWVTGIRWKQIGTVETESISEAFTYADYTYFAQEGTVPVLLVVCWPTQNPLFVPFDGFRVAADVERPKPNTRAPYDDRVRAEMSMFAKEMPRDARGRFVKER